MNAVDLVFASPRKLPKAAALRGRVVVLDVAFAAGPGLTLTFEARRIGPDLHRLADLAAALAGGLEDDRRQAAARPLSPSLRRA